MPSTTQINTPEVQDEIVKEQSPVKKSVEKVLAESDAAPIVPSGDEKEKPVEADEPIVDAEEVKADEVDEVESKDEEVSTATVAEEEAKEQDGEAESAVANTNGDEKPVEESIQMDETEVKNGKRSLEDVEPEISPEKKLKGDSEANAEEEETVADESVTTSA